MMKIIFMLIFMIPLCFKKKMFWLVQMKLFLMSFLFLIMNLSLVNFTNLSYFYSIDLISYGLILLSIWICGLMIMASQKLNQTNYYDDFFLINILILLLFLILTFSTMNLFMFYMYFEASLIPTLILIMGWGYQPERIQASLYLLFYTLFASLPLLMGIFYGFYKMNCLMIYFMSFYSVDYFLIYLSMIFAFLVKMPMYFTHLWLPKAHVEAPVSGSMILAGIMLKLGGYGLLRVMIIFQKLNMNMGLMWVIISMMGGVYISMKCFFQIDMKSLIAYSSVAHMGMVIGGIMTMNYWGFMGSYLMMIGHGLCSSGMFCLSNINYERLHSRSLFINKGMLSLMPSMSMWWFMFMACNMAAPPSMNLMGEISLMNSLISWSWMLMMNLMLMSFLSAGYSLYLFSFTQHGKLYLGNYSFYLGYIREFLLLMLHLFPLNLLILKIDYFIF